MAPKRKRAEDPAPATTATSSKATRSSTRLGAKAGTATQETAPTTSASTEPATKRTRTTKAAAAPKEKKTTAKKATKKNAGANAEDEPTKPPLVNGATGATVPPNGSSPSPPNPVPAQQPERPTTPPLPSQPPAAKPQTSLKYEPYTAQRALALFAKYADSDDSNVIGPDGFEALCTDAGIPLDGALPLILAWQLNAQEMAKISKDEWVKGTATLKVACLPALSTALTDLQNLLILQQGAAQKPTGKKDEVYDRTLYNSYTQDIQGSFGKLYTYCFSLAKQEGSRNIDMEASTSCAFWSVLLVTQYPIMQSILDFLSEKPNYKATNKDLWSMMLEFCRTVNPSLQDYEADGAWPTLLDDFVAWKKEKMTSAEQ